MATEIRHKVGREEDLALENIRLVLGEVADPSSPVVPERNRVHQKARDSLLAEMG